MWLADIFRDAPGRRFFDLLDRQAAVLFEAAQALSAFVDSGDPKLASAIDGLERKGDEYLHALIDAISDTFVTPLDRQDLYNLGEALDDMLDYMTSAALEISLFDQASTPAMREMCRVLVHAAGCVRGAIASIATDRPAARAAARQASLSENRMEEIYRKTLAELFRGDDVRAMLKLREIYRHLSNGADRADAIGKLVGKIVVKTS